MACRQYGVKPLSEPVLPYCQLEPKEYISVKFYLKFNCFHSRKCTSKCGLRNGGHFVSASMCLKIFDAPSSTLCFITRRKLGSFKYAPFCKICLTHCPLGRARRFPPPVGLGQVKLPVGQVDLNRIFLFISYKQIEEFQNSWSRAIDDLEKRQALPGRCGCRLKLVHAIFKLISRIDIFSIALRWMLQLKTSLVISQHWFR